MSVYNYETARNMLVDELSFEKGLKHSIRKWGETTDKEYRRSDKCGLCMVAENVMVSETVKAKVEHITTLNYCNLLSVVCPFATSRMCHRLVDHLEKHENFFSLKRSEGFSRLMLKTLRSKKVMDEVLKHDEYINNHIKYLNNDSV